MARAAKQQRGSTRRVVATIRDSDPALAARLLDLMALLGGLRAAEARVEALSRELRACEAPASRR